MRDAAMCYFRQLCWLSILAIACSQMSYQNLSLLYINLKNILNIFIYTTGGNCCVLLYLGFWDENKKVDKGKMNGKRDLILSGHGTAGAGACQ